MYLRFKLIFLLFIFYFFSSCVDNSYDFNRIDADKITLGDNWNAPLGTLQVNMEDVVNIDDIPSLFINSQNEYYVKYSSEIDLGTSVQDLLQSSGFVLKNIDFVDQYFKLATTEFLIDHYEGTFGENFTIGIRNPNIILKSDLNSATDLPLRLNIEAKNSSSIISTTNDFSMDTTNPNAWISQTIPSEHEIKQINESKNELYVFETNNKLSDILAITPEKITTSLWINPKDLQIDNVSFSKVEFILGFPLTPTNRFYAETTRLIRDVFDEDLFSSLLIEGRFSLYGTIQNKMPTKLKVELTLLDENDQELGFVIDSKTLEVGETGDIRLDVNDDDIEAIKQARHISAHFELTGSNNSETLKTKDFARINLKISKSKGIEID